MIEAHLGQDSVMRVTAAVKDAYISAGGDPERQLAARELVVAMLATLLSDGRLTREEATAETEWCCERLRSIVREALASRSTSAPPRQLQ